MIARASRPAFGKIPGKASTIAAIAVCGSLAAVIAIAAGSLAGAGKPVRDDLSPEDRARVAAITAPTTTFEAPERYERMAGGAGTSLKPVSRDSFSTALANTDAKTKFDIALGESLFEKLWVSSPATTRASDGLGPRYNARACAGCHPRDGRGDAPSTNNGDGVDVGSLILHLSIAPRTAEEREAIANRRLAAIPDPALGRQLQTRAVPGLPREGTLAIGYTEIPVALSGGETATLRKPAYAIAGADRGADAAPLLVSPRLAPALPGLGLLEQVHEADILALADPGDRDDDGISGRPSRVRDPETGALLLGRYGWKASLPSVRIQSADAFSGDIGISTPPYPAAAGDCTPRQTECLAMPTGVNADLGAVEAPDPVLALVSTYVGHLAPPARRNLADPDVLRGKRRFHEAGCAACHRPKFVTRRDAPDPAQRFQLIWPYSDLLLHDMGPGLADDRPVGDASGREWRTAPLWSIGLAKTVNPKTGFLHDGRARTLLEAVLWHGGEARAARDAVVAMDPRDRAALIRFLESL